MLLVDNHAVSGWTYLVVFVDSVHSLLRLFLGDDLASILDDDLVWLESTIASNAISPIQRLDNFDANVVFTALLDSLSQAFEATVPALIFSQPTIAIITLVEHESIHAITVTSSLRLAYTG